MRPAQWASQSSGPLAPPPGDPGRLRRAQRGGVLGAVLVLLAFGTFNALTVPPFLAGDESAHINYALEVSAGRLPLFDDRFPPRLPGLRNTPTWTAMHPPLYYGLVAVPLRLGVDSGFPLAGLFAARLMTVLLAAGAVVLTAHLAAGLVPGRPAVPVVSAGGLALVPSFQQVAGLVYNDALAVLTTTAVLALVVITIRQGCTRRRLALLALTAAAAAASRATGLEVAALAVLAAATPVGRERGQPWRQRLRPAAGRCAVVGGAVAATSGWFYLRNLLLYGSLDGSSRASQLGTTKLPLREALRPAFWLDQYDQLWGFVVSNLPLTGVPAVLARALLVAALAGLVLALARRLSAGAERLGGPLGLAWAVVGLHAVVTVAAVLSYFARGGIPFGRYFFSLLPLLPVLAAVGWTSLPGSRRGLPAVLALVSAAAVGLAMTVLVLGDVSPLRGPLTVARVLEMLALAGLPLPAAALVTLLGMLGLGLLLLSQAVVRLSRP